MEFELDSEQQKAISNLSGPSLILASAGTGKTRTLMAKTAAIIDSGVHPTNIMLVTFTNKATNEMKSRLHDMGYNITGMWLGTFHNICNRILKEHNNKIPGLDDNYTIILPDDSKKRIKTIMGDEFPDTRIKSSVVSDIISYARNAMTYNSDNVLLESIDNSIEDSVEQRFTAYTDYVELIKKVHLGYHRMKLENNVVDFDDILVYASYILIKNDNIREEYERMFHHILVDEYQDTNTVQAVMLYLLRMKNFNITVVGDEAQAIYEWRAANINHILTFRHNFKGVEVHTVPLIQNYRSTPQIIDVALSSIQHNELKIDDKIMIPNHPNGPVPILTQHQTITSEMAHIASRIHEHIKNGIAPNQIAVLLRSLQVEKFGLHNLIGQYLFSNGIKYVVFGGRDVFDAKHTRDFIAFVELLYNPKNTIALERILNLLPGIGQKSIDTAVQSMGDDPYSHLENVKLKSKKANQSLAMLQSIMEYLIPSINDPDTTIDEYYNAFFDFYISLHHKPDYKIEKRMDELNEFVKGLAAMPVRDFLHEMQFKSTSSANKAQVPDDHVVISTIHQTKGLEWDVVLIGGCNENILPHYRAIEGDAIRSRAFKKIKDDDGHAIKNLSIEEERRLFYVAVTRARSVLELSMSKNNAFGGELKPSRFITEIHNTSPDALAFNQSNDYRF